MNRWAKAGITGTGWILAALGMGYLVVDILTEPVDVGPNRPKLAKVIRTDKAAENLQPAVSGTALRDAESYPIDKSALDFLDALNSHYLWKSVSVANGSGSTRFHRKKRGCDLDERRTVHVPFLDKDDVGGLLTPTGRGEIEKSDVPPHLMGKVAKALNEKRIRGVPFAYQIGNSVFVNVAEADGGRAREERDGTIVCDVPNQLDDVRFHPGSLYMGSFGYKKDKLEKGETTLIRSPFIIRGNDIIECYMAFYIRDGKMYAHAFLDEDWKKNLGGKTVFVWYNPDMDRRNERGFEWNEIADGVYMDTLDLTEAGHFVGVFAGKSEELKGIEKPTIGFLRLNIPEDATVSGFYFD